MKNQTPREEFSREMLQLAKALNDLRDSLVEAGLILKDFHFDRNAVERSAAVEQSKELIEKVKPR